MRSIWLLAGFNVLLWGFWISAFVDHRFSSAEQRHWYFDGPLTVMLLTGFLPILALRHAVASAGWRAILRIILVISLLGFLPYACMSGGGI